MNSFRVLIANHRSHLYAVVQLVACRYRFHSRFQLFQQRPVDFVQHDQPLRRYAHLPGVRIATCQRRLLNHLHIGVWHYDEWTVGAQFHRHALNASNFTDLLADFLTAGEADLANSPVFAKGRADRCSAARDAGNGQRRNSRFQKNLDELQGNQWCITGRF